MDTYDLKKTRNNLVAKDNRMIQNSRFSLSPVENKAVLYLISMIQPDDEPGKLYEFNCKEFQALIKWSEDASYTKVKEMLTNLSLVQWWMDLDDQGNEALVRWFNIVHMNRGTGNLSISFHDDMFPFLLDLQKHLEEDGHYYTTYKLQCVSLMKHRYSPRIYELLKSYQFNNKQWTFENGTGSIWDIQRRIADTVLDDDEAPVAPASWSNWAVFKRDVLEPAVKEINKYTDIKVAYEGFKEDIHHKKTRAVRTIRFYMVGKTSPEQRETDSIIDAEYREIENDSTYHQMSISELFFSEHEKKLEEEQQEQLIVEQEEFEERIKKSKYPVLTSCIGKDFSDDQIEYLFTYAINKRVAGVIAFKNWEMFATDYITDCLQAIKADSDNTKTTTYKRLLDALKNDYNNVADTYLRKYE